MPTALSNEEEIATCLTNKIHTSVAIKQNSCFRWLCCFVFKVQDNKDELTKISPWGKAWKKFSVSLADWNNNELKRHWRGELTTCCERLPTIVNSGSSSAANRGGWAIGQPQDSRTRVKLLFPESSNDQSVRILTELGRRNKNWQWTGSPTLRQRCPAKLNAKWC